MNARNKKIVIWSVVGAMSFALAALGFIFATATESTKAEKKSSGFERVQNEVNEVIDSAQKQFDDELH